MNIFIEPEHSNAEAVFRALAAFGAPLIGFTVEDFEDVSTVYQIGQPPLRIDLIKALEGITFQQAWNGRVEALEEDIPVHYIGRNELITNKLATGRLQDLADAESLRFASKATKSNDTDETL